MSGRSVMVDKTSQDWKLLYSAEQNGYTIFKFSRPIKLCGAEDRTVDEGSPHVIFAWSDQDPAPGQDISYHGATNRGTKDVILISGPKKDEQVFTNLEELHFPIENVKDFRFFLIQHKFLLYFIFNLDSTSIL